MSRQAGGIVGRPVAAGLQAKNAGRAIDPGLDAIDGIGDADEFTHHGKIGGRARFRERREQLAHAVQRHPRCSGRPHGGIVEYHKICRDRSRSRWAIACAIT